ncbi:hypothetical protein ACWD4K_33325 [Streptomyces gelaticus]
MCGQDRAQHLVHRGLLHVAQPGGKTAGLRVSCCHCTITDHDITDHNITDHNITERKRRSHRPVTPTRQLRALYKHLSDTHQARAKWAPA